jgi:ribosome-binding protein aMBF1 (putative translation factor)
MAKRRTSKKGTLATWQDENPLRAWRMKQPPEGWNCSVLARQLGVSHSAVASWEKGEKLPVIDTFSKIEKLTGISTVQWMEWFARKPEKE